MFVAIFTDRITETYLKSKIADFATCNSLRISVLRAYSSAVRAGDS